jgi:hypothetical protein
MNKNKIIVVDIEPIKNKFDNMKSARFLSLLMRKIVNFYPNTDENIKSELLSQDTYLI